MQKSRKGSRRKTSPGRAKNSILYKNIRSFPLQPLAEHWVPQATAVLSTTVATGVITLAFGAADCVTNTTQWAARFGNTYEEYRVVKCVTMLRFFSVINPGVVCAYYEERSATVPSAASALEKASHRLAASSSDYARSLVWTPTDLTDLNFKSTGTASSPVYIKIYTDNANFGSSIVATPYLLLEVKALVQFRGYATV
jgi:hypothetical protein